MKTPWKLTFKKRKKEIYRQHLTCAKTTLAYQI